MKLLTLKIAANLLLITLSHAVAFGQITKKWESRYTEIGYSDDSGEQVITDLNGNSFVLAHTGFDAVVIKYDSSGKLVWSFQAGRGVFMENYYPTISRDFKLGADGHIYLLLSGTDKNNLASVCLIKIDPNGNQLWQQIMSGSLKVALALQPDGSAYVFRQNGYYGALLSKVTNAGVVAWTKTYTHSTDELHIQDVTAINDRVVVWYYTGYQTYHRKSSMHVYDFDGVLTWKNEYKFDTQGTHVRALQYHANELYVAYYITNSSNGFHRIIRYNMTDGSVKAAFNFNMDNVFQRDEELACMFVGEDSQIYVMGENGFNVKKMTPTGQLTWAYTYRTNLASYEVYDYVYHKETSTADILLKINNFNASVTYSVVSFLPDKTNKVLATITTSKPNTVPRAFTELGPNLYVTGSFTKNDNFNRDVLLTKFTKSNSRVWDATYGPANTEQHAPSCMAGDAQGNVYVGGLLGLGPNQSGFGIIKYDPSGKQVWVTKFAPGNQYGFDQNRTMVTAIAVTDEGEVAVTGAIRMGNQFSTIREPPVEMYTVKLDVNGSIAWTSKTSGLTDDYITGFQIGFDQDKNIYTLGSNYNLNNSDRNRMVLVKYDESGNQKWEKRFSKYTDYTNMATTGRDTELPKMKIVSNQAYVFYKGMVTEDGWNYKPAMEIRKFSSDGSETLLNQTICSECISNDYRYDPRDFILDDDGNIYLLYDQATFGYKTVLKAISSTGQSLWLREIVNSSYRSDGAIALGSSNELYLITTSLTELNYSKINSSGIEVWNKKEKLNGFDPNSGHPVFVFTHAAGSPIFISTNKNEENSRYFFMTERDKDTGDVKSTQVFDEVFDTYGSLPYWRPGDHLLAFFKPSDTDDFFVSGVIEDKSRNAETIVTLKYGIGKLSQEISFDPIANVFIGDTPIILSASASSGLPVAYESSPTPNDLNGNSFTIATPGRHTITASQQGNGAYVAAQPVSQSFCVNPAKPTITSSNNFTLTSSANSGNQWYLNGLPIEGEVNQTLSVTVSGEYSVQVKVDDCSSLPSLIFSALITAIDSPLTDPISAYPNPVSDFVYLSGVSTGATVSATDILGKHYNLSFQEENNLLKTDVRNMASGIIILWVSEGNRYYKLKLSKRY